MKLSEKIYTCRKKAGLSQEALAEKLDVSRQAVSKWETAEATPELSKIPMMAKIFGVTADWLLSDEEEYIAPYAREAQHAEPKSEPQRAKNNVNTAGRFINRWIWLIGVYIAIVGAGIALIGAAVLIFTCVATTRTIKGEAKPLTKEELVQTDPIESMDIEKNYFFEEQEDTQ